MNPAPATLPADVGNKTSIEVTVDLEQQKIFLLWVNNAGSDGLSKGEIGLCPEFPSYQFECRIDHCGEKIIRSWGSHSSSVRSILKVLRSIDPSPATIGLFIIPDQDLGPAQAGARYPVPRCSCGDPLQALDRWLYNLAHYAKFDSALERSKRAPFWILQSFACRQLGLPAPAHPGHRLMHRLNVLINYRETRVEMSWRNVDAEANIQGTITSSTPGELCWELKGGQFDELISTTLDLDEVHNQLAGCSSRTSETPA